MDPSFSESFEAELARITHPASFSPTFIAGPRQPPGNSEPLSKLDYVRLRHRDQWGADLDIVPFNPSLRSEAGDFSESLVELWPAIRVPTVVNGICCNVYCRGSRCFRKTQRIAQKNCVPGWNVCRWNAAPNFLLFSLFGNGDALVRESRPADARKIKAH